MASAIQLLLQTDELPINSVLRQDISFIETLDSGKFTEYIDKKAKAMSKLFAATELAEKGPSSHTNFKLTKGTPKAAKLVHSASLARMDKPTKEKSKDKHLSRDRRDEKRQHSMPSVAATNTDQSDDSFEEDSDEIKFSYTDESYQFPKIKSATIDKLIERLTHEVYPGM